MKILFLHLLNEGREVREAGVVHGKVFVPFHVVDVHVDRIDWYGSFFIPCVNLTNILLRLIPPAALPEAECPLRRNIAFSGDAAESPNHFFRGFRRDAVNVRTFRYGADREQVQTGIADVKVHCPRVVDKNTFGAFLSRRREKKKVLGSIEGVLVLRVIRVIRIVTGIEPSAFVHSANSFSQAIYDGGRRQWFCYGSAFLLYLPSGKMGNGWDFRHFVIQDCSCMNRRSQSVSFNHIFLL